MSLLLEALKKAALEKQNRSSNEAEQGRPAAEPEQAAKLGDTLEQGDAVEPVSPAAEPEVTLTSEVSLDIELDEAFLSEEPEVESDESEQELVFEPEFEPEIELTEKLDDEEAEEDTEIELAADEVSEESAQESEAPVELVDEAELAAAREKLEQEQALELQRQQLEQERAQIEQARLAEEQEKERQAELERQKQAELEKQRQDEAAAKQRAIQAEKSREALDQLITSGKQIHKKAKRRSAFLYILLLLTAVGGLSAYYIFLIANTGKSELVATVASDPNPDIANVAEMLLSDPVPVEAETNNEQGSLTEPETPTAFAITDASTPLQGQVGQLTEVSPSTGETTGSELEPTSTTTTNPPAADTGVETATNNSSESGVATRIDPPPSATAYLRTLIMSATGEPQTQSMAERVIIHHKAGDSKASQIIADAYLALQQGDLVRAETLYGSALKLDPNQRDALLGAAAVATNLKQFDTAIQLYQRRLQTSPDDVYARAGLLGLASDANSRASVEQQVEEMLEQYPEAAHLHFLKGVTMAGNTEWQSAQTAFYEAYRLEADNPDYAFNLAVSLDHLAQSSLARVYYERALSLSEARQSNFEQAQVRQRISELTGQ